MGKTNLYEETIAFLRVNNKTEEDILWAGCQFFQVPLDSFWEVAKNTYYDSGYGSQEIASDLVLCGKDFWLARTEYDGSEGWVFEYMPEKPTETKPLKKLTGRWSSLLDLNG